MYTTRVLKLPPIPSRALYGCGAMDACRVWRDEPFALGDHARSVDIVRSLNQRILLQLPQLACVDDEEIDDTI